MNTLSLDDRALGWHLGLGDLGDISPVCFGYRNGCGCERCEARQEATSPAFLRWLELGPDDESDPPALSVGPRQPWDVRAPKARAA